MRRVIGIGWAVSALGFLLLAGWPAWAQKKPLHLGVWIYGSDGKMYELKRSQARREVLPGITGAPDENTVRLERFNPAYHIATEAGRNYYPFMKTEALNGIFEHDPLSGEYYGPAVFSSRWNPEQRILKTEYTNGYYTERMGKFRPPPPLAQATIEDVIIGGDSNLYWIRHEPHGNIRIYHQNTEDSRIPFTELVFGKKIEKVRGNTTGDGLFVLFESGVLATMLVDEDNDLRVIELNDPSKYLVLDFASGPIDSELDQFALITQGLDVKTGQPVASIHEKLDLKKRHAIDMRVMTSSQQDGSIPRTLTFGIETNTHSIELQSEKSKLQRPGVDHEALDLHQILRKRVFDEQFPEMCRYYFESFGGFESHVYLN